VTGSEGHEGVNIDVYILSIHLTVFKYFYKLLGGINGLDLHACLWVLQLFCYVFDLILTYVPCQRCTSLHKAVGVSELCQNYADAEMKKARSLKRDLLCTALT